MARNSKVIIAKNIKLDRNYTNVINYTEQQMLDLINANGNKVAESLNCSFIRTTGTIKTPFTYSQCLQSNYMAFQNPDYDNKWFFAWIDDVIYKSDGTGELKFTIDIFSTWFNKLTLNQVNVIREHVNDDTIGLHTVPESIDVGDYVINESLVDDLNRNTQEEPYCIVVASTIDFNNDDNVYMAKYNGIPSGIRYFYWHINDINSVINNIKRVETLHKGAIQSIFIAPYWLASSIDDFDPSSETHPDYHTNHPAFESISFGKLNSLDTYVPKNKKLLTYPYYAIQISNGQGSDNILKPELWKGYSGSDPNINQGDLVLFMVGVLCQGCAIRVTPLNYEGENNNNENGINLGKFPQISWNSDAFINWLTSTGVNIATNLLGAGITAVTGNVIAGVATQSATKNLLSKNISKAENVNGIKENILNNMETNSNSINLASMMNSGIQSMLVPPAVSGNTNCGDLMTADELNCLHIYQKTIKREFAKIIDDYFTKVRLQSKFIKSSKHNRKNLLELC